jgi:phosphatidyl-myo-inositol alpha-mannosyltransferase
VKIGLVSPYIYPLAGGVNQHVRFLYENLRQRGHEVRIISAAHGFQRSSEGDVIRLGKGFSMPANGSMGTITLSPRYISQARRLLDEERFDVLHFHEPFVPFLSLVVLQESQSVNIATFHAYGGWSPAYEFGKSAMRRYAARLHGRIAVSAAARHFIDRYFPGDYKVIPNGVDPTRIQRAVPLTRWQDGTRNILFVGRFEPRKGVLELLKGYRALRKLGFEDTRLLLVGGGPQEREARRYVATRRLQGVHFLGRVSDDERNQLFRTCDVYVTPATGRESFGIVLLEAMAAGAPIVASDIHGYKGVVRRGREALLVPPKDPDAIGEAIATLLRDAELAARFRENGLVRAEEFSWPRVTAKVDDYYGFVIRRLAAAGELPPHFHSAVPASPRVGLPLPLGLGVPGLDPAHQGPAVLAED